MSSLEPTIVREGLGSRADFDRAAKRAARGKTTGYAYHPTSLCYVLVVPGDAPPIVTGRRGYFTTPSGKTVVLHPGAYGWRTVYWASDLHVEVGADWRPEVW